MITSPDLEASRSRLGDWLELCALFSPHGAAGQAEVASVARLASDEHREIQKDDGQLVEPEILETDLEENLDRIAEEIFSRLEALGEDYPFTVTKQPFRLSVRGELKDQTDAAWVYLFLLMLSATRDGFIPKTQDVDKRIREARVLFHVCASIGVAGLLRNAKTIWFGWPRPEKTNFLNALAQLCTKLGYGKAKTRIPGGYPDSPKDDQIDVIGWRSFRDKRNGNLLVFCQAATGHDWRDKSLLAHLEAFGLWFELEPYARPTGAIAIPFPAHHEVDEHDDGFELSRHRALHLAQMDLGVLIDRVRIVESVRDVLAHGTEGIDGIDKLPELKGWVTDTVEAIKVAA
jgi:hypothetical protein